MLILELDEHGADVGYLTRMEAFVDVIRYHHSRKSKVKTRAKKVTSAPAPVKSAAAEDPLAGRKIWVPQMHPISSRLGAAAFRSIGLDCEMMPLETRESYELGRRLTRGSECLPNALTIGSLVHTLNKLGEPGKKHAYFMPTAEGPCRFGQYATLHRQVLDKCGYPDVHIISPTSLDTYGGLIDAIWYSLWTGFITGDLLMKMACRVRPYEMEQGKTNIVLERGIKQMEHAIEKNDAVETVFRKVLEEMAAIPQHPTRNRPLVGIVGEIYVRANTFANENVIAAVESFGGEAWLAPMSEWLIYTAFFEGFRFKERYINHRISDAGGLRYYFLKESEHQWHEIASPYLDDRHEPPIEEVLASGEKFITKYIEGEAVLTVGRALQFIQQGASMIINCAPFGCMPGTISTALHQEVQARYGVPILNLFYDGEGLQNEKIAIFLSNLRRERKREETACERHERVSRQL